MNHDSIHPQTQGSAARFRATQLIGCKITNSRDEALGDIQDIVLTGDQRGIAYVVVGFGGFLGMGEKYFAMPWRLIKVSRGATDKKPRVGLAVDQKVLEAAPGFAKDNWPDMADMSWSRQVDSYYSTRAATSGVTTMSNTGAAPVADAFAATAVGRDPDSDAFHFRRVSQLLGMTVVDAARETIAKVDDLILDAEHARIEGAALSFGGMMGMGKRIALVPLQSLTLERGKGVFAMACTTADLEALALPGTEWPLLDSDEWLTRARHQCDRTTTVRGESAAAWEA